MSPPPIAPSSMVTTARGRVVWIDRLRVALTTLVVLHHAAITYGASGSWFFRATHETSLPLTFFAAVNQAFFMGLFFMVSGLLAPASLARKGLAAFLSDRALRLGLPVLVFGFVLGPLTVALASAPLAAVSAAAVARIALGEFVLGPMWFPAALLAFSVLLALRPAKSTRIEPTPPFAVWLTTALLTGLAALLIRQAAPVGQSVFGFQFGYFASYVVLFVIGVRAGERGWLLAPLSGDLRRAMAVGAVALPALPLALLGSDAPRYETGFSTAAVVYAFWEPLVALGAVAALIAWSRGRGERAAAFWSAASANSYGAFILHAPILVAASRLLAERGVAPAAALPLSAAATTAAAFGLAAVLRRWAPVRWVI